MQRGGIGVKDLAEKVNRNYQERVRTAEIADSRLKGCPLEEEIRWRRFNIDGKGRRK